MFVAAGFNPRSASACVLAAVRDGRFRLIWNQSTQREIEMILRRIRRLYWEEVANLYQPEVEFTLPVDLAPLSSCGIGTIENSQH